MFQFWQAWKGRSFPSGVHANNKCWSYVLFAFDSMDALVILGDLVDLGADLQDVLGGDFFGGDGIAPDL